MQTAEFKTAGGNPNAVAICLKVPDWYSGKRYMPLAPTPELLALARANADNPQIFAVEYMKQLAALDPQKVWNELGPNAILICWEPFGKRCHRRLVAEWFEKHLREEVSEFGRPRYKCKPFVDLPAQRPRWPVKPKKSAPKTPPSPGLF